MFLALPASAWLPCSDRIFHYGHGVSVQADTGFWGDVRRVRVLEADGTMVEFNRTHRSIRALLYNDVFPAHYFDPALLLPDAVSILDVGCSDGRVVRELRNWGVEATGVDIYLTPRARRRSFLVMADARKMPFESNSFDRVMSSWSAITYLTSEEYRENPRLRQTAGEILREMARVTRDSILLSPVPYRGRNGFVDFPALEALMSEYTPNLRIRARPDRNWLKRVHVPEIGRAAEYHLEKAEVWVELEKD